ncbi:MAG TPA: 30S ribosomal protein S6 [Polyangiaceae bacterium]
MPKASAGPVRTREYETIYILRPDVTRDAQERVAQRVNEVMTKGKGTLTSIENWGRRQLSFPVNKQKRGVYVYLKYLGQGDVVNELERNLRMLDDVVKYQTVNVRKEVDPASVNVKAEDVKFEAVEPPQPGEDEGERIEQILGFEDSPERQRPAEGDVEEEFGGAEEPAQEPGQEAQS